MKLVTTIFFCLFYFILITPISTQSTQALKTKVGTEWYYQAWDPTPNGESVKVYIDRDTTVNQTSCTVMKIQRSGVDVIGSEIILYENNEQIFFYENDSFFKLYDFSSSLSVGDTIEYNLPSNANLYDISSSGSEVDPIVNPYYLELTEIDFVLSEEGTQLKRYTTNSYVNLDKFGEPCNDIRTIIEGVGSLSGFLGQNCFQLTAGFGPYFRCYSSDTINYRAVQGACDLSNSIVDDHNVQNLKVFPNPFRNSISINDVRDIQKCQIINHLGEVVVNEYSFDSDLSMLTTGIYFVRFEVKGDVVVQKIMKL